jgi:hypothetical protein
VKLTLCVPKCVERKKLWSDAKKLWIDPKTKEAKPIPQFVILLQLGCRSLFDFEIAKLLGEDLSKSPTLEQRSSFESTLEFLKRINVCEKDPDSEVRSMIRFYKSVEDETNPILSSREAFLPVFRSHQNALNVPTTSIHGGIGRNIPQDVPRAPVQIVGGATDVEEMNIMDPELAQLEPEPLLSVQEVVNYQRIQEDEHRGLLTEL